MNAFNKDRAASYTATLADVSNPDAMAVLGVDSQTELEALFAEIDLNKDGHINGDEACRHYIANHDFMCDHFSVDQDYRFVGQIKYWIENPHTDV